MAEGGESCAFLIAGGYHTDHLTQLWRDEGPSYVVLAPLITDETDQAQYEKLLLSSYRSEKDRRIAARPSSASETRSTLRWKSLAEPGGEAVGAVREQEEGLSREELEAVQALRVVREQF